MWVGILITGSWNSPSFDQEIDFLAIIPPPTFRRRITILRTRREGHRCRSIAGSALRMFVRNRATKGGPLPMEGEGRECGGRSTSTLS